jgi:4-hydroxybenzoate polyprenyltransferase
MGFLGDLAKAILVTWVVFWVVTMISFAVSGQTAVALLFLVGLLIPLAFIAYEYWQYRKRKMNEIGTYLWANINILKYLFSFAHTEFK